MTTDLTAEDEQLAQAALDAFRAVLTALSRMNWWIVRADLSDPDRRDIAETLTEFGLSPLPLGMAEAFAGIAQIVSGDADFINEAIEDFADVVKADARAGIAEAMGRFSPPI
jgi:hypothetical protein